MILLETQVAIRDAVRDLAQGRIRLDAFYDEAACAHPAELFAQMAALEHRGGRKGVATLCIGGGEATAVALEMI